MPIILTKKSDTASAVPLAADLTNNAGGAELAVNATDKRLYSKTSGGSVVELGTNPSSLTMPNGTANGLAFLNASKVVTSGSALTFDGTNLGIGTSSPASLWSGAYQLVVGSGSGGAGATIYTSNSTTGTLAFADGTAGDAAYRGYVQYAHTTDSLVLGTGGTTKATIDSSGNLGLGVTPSAWSGYKVLQAGIASFAGGSSGAYLLQDNAYTDNSGAGWKYINSGYAAAQYYAASGAHVWRTAASGTAGNAITFTQAMTLDASGNLLLGTTTPTYQASGRGLFEVNGSSSALLALKTGNAGRGYIYTQGTDLIVSSETGANTFQTANASPVIFATNGSERARIDSSGRLLVGVTTGSNRVRISGASSGTGGAAALGFSAAGVNNSCNIEAETGLLTSSYGTIAMGVANPGNGYYISFSAPDGSYNYAIRGSIALSGTSIAYNTSSDYRLKKDIAPMSGALAKVALLKPVTYKWLDDSEGEGFIAHELAEVVPQCVTGEKDAVDENGNPKYQGIDTSFLVATLTAAIQEQQAIIDSLKARLDAANL